MPVARHQLPDVPPPRARRGLGEVSRAPVLMSFVLISGSCCHRQFWSPIACDDERRAPAVKSGVSLLVDAPCQTVLFRALLPSTRCPDFHHLRPLGHRPRRLRSALLSPPAAPSVTDLDGCVVRTDASGHGVRRRRRRRQ